MGASGTYNFQDVNFTGTAAFPAAPGSALFVTNQAVTGGNGSFATPYGVTEADAVTTSNVTFAFLDGTYNFATLGAATGFSLAATQSATGFENGNSVSFGTLQPANVTGSFGVTGGTVKRGDPGSGTGSLSITNGAPASVFTLGGSNSMTDLNITGLGGATNPTTLISSSAAVNTAGITLSGLIISNLQAGQDGV